MCAHSTCRQRPPVLLAHAGTTNTAVYSAPLVGPRHLNRCNAMTEVQAAFIFAHCRQLYTHRLPQGTLHPADAPSGCWSMCGCEVEQLPQVHLDRPEQEAAQALA